MAETWTKRRLSHKIRSASSDLVEFRGRDYKGSRYWSIHWVYHVRTSHALWRGTEDVHLLCIKAENLWKQLWSFFPRPHLTVGTAVTELRNLNEWEFLAPDRSSNKWWHSITKGKWDWTLAWANTKASDAVIMKSVSCLLMMLISWSWHSYKWNH